MTWKFESLSCAVSVRLKILIWRIVSSLSKSTCHQGFDWKFVWVTDWWPKSPSVLPSTARLASPPKAVELWVTRFPKATFSSGSILGWVGFSGVTVFLINWTFSNLESRYPWLSRVERLPILKLSKEFKRLSKYPRAPCFKLALPVEVTTSVSLWINGPTTLSLSTT